MRTIEQLTRPNIRGLKPYSSARDEYKGREASVFLDANENPYSPSYNRYPDPLQHRLKERLSRMKGVDPGQLFLGNGSDEAIDLLFRAFCQPAVDNVVAIDPTYGMYQVCADINDVAYRKVLLDADFQFRADDLLAAADEHTKLIFLCSPNNPTGNDLRREEIDRLLDKFDGLVVLDEAYIDFSGQPSYTGQLRQYPNLVVLQTFSKAWGSAAIRLGMAFASPEIIAVFNKIKYPYNINQLTQEQALRLLDEPEKIQNWVSVLNKERGQLMERFAALPFTERVFPSDANFFLVRVSDAGAIYNYLVGQGIIVRNRHSVSLCGNCLRITIGTSEENNILLETLKRFTMY
ncbi:MAG: histidinol-phosphate transaminase [Bacteroides sp.]|nr:histidinol-phosphate transaminase [Bacteroides sp.]